MTMLRDRLRAVTTELASVSGTPRLDAELIFAHTLEVDRAYLMAHGERCLTEDEVLQGRVMVVRRLAGEPMAYLLGQQAFWDMTLTVTPDVLVPRPETELLVEMVLANEPAAKRQCLELGVGSGAITCALAQARPAWTFTATDISEAALQVARRNASRYGLSTITWACADLFEGVPAGTYDVIVSNPPYIAEDDPCLLGMGVRHEPRLALTAGGDGLEIIKRLIPDATAYLIQGGRLYLEHGATQGEAARGLMVEAGYDGVQTLQDGAGLDRLTLGTNT